MTDIIEAFVASIGFDTRAYDRGTKRVQENDKKTREQFRESAKDIEASGKRASGYFRGLRNEAVGLFLAFAGATSIKNFVTDIIHGDAATGRLAANLGVATESLSAWQGALKRVGGQSGDADNAFRTITAMREARKIFGDTSKDPILNALGVTTKDLASGSEAVLLKVAEASQRMRREDFVSLASQLGISESTITLLAKGRQGVQEYLDEQRRLGVVTDESARSAQEFEDRLAQLGSVIKAGARPQIYALVDGLVKSGDAARIATNLVDLFAASIRGLASVGDTLSYSWLAAQKTYYELRAKSASDPASKLAWLEKASGAAKSMEDIAVRNDQRFGRGGGGAARGTTDAQQSRGDDLRGQAASIGGRGGGNAGRIAAYLRSQGFSSAQVRGIVAGIHAENGSFDPNAVNPTSGAHGIGQWLGPRRAAFRKLIGRDIVGSSLEQQMRFLAHELRGGDHGGAAVMGQTTAEGTLGAYVHNFMRPGAGAGGDMRRGMAYLGGRMPSGGGMGGGGSTSTSIGQIIVYSPDPDRAADAVRTGIARRGLVVQSNSGLSQ